MIRLVWRVAVVDWSARREGGRGGGRGWGRVGRRERVSEGKTGRKKEEGKGEG